MLICADQTLSHALMPILVSFVYYLEFNTSLLRSPFNWVCFSWGLPIFMFWGECDL